VTRGGTLNIHVTNLFKKRMKTIKN